MSSFATVRSSARRTFRTVYDGWFTIVAAFSWVLARIAALLVFVVGFVPYGIVVRLTALDPLNRTFDETEDSYWKEPPSQNDSIEEFRRQY